MTCLESFACQFTSNEFVVTFLFLLHGDPAWSGAQLVVMNVTRMIFQPLIAYWVDLSRTHLNQAFRIGTTLLIPQTLLHLAAVELSIQSHYGMSSCRFPAIILSAAYALLALVQSFLQPTTVTLVGMSSVLGKRTDFFTTQSTVTEIFSCIGLMALAVIIWIHGNIWTVTLAGRMLQIGYASYLLAIPLYLMLDVKYTEADGGGKMKIMSEDSPQTHEVSDRQHNGSSSIWENSSNQQLPSCKSWCTERKTPLLLETSNVVWIVGEGLFMPFFYVLLIQKYDVSPQTTTIINICSRFLSVFAISFSRWVALRQGRVQTIMLAGFMMILCNVVMAMLIIFRLKSSSLCWLIILYITRVILGISVGPSYMSILMDTVPSAELTRWEACTLLQSALYSASTLAGGHAIAMYGYGISLLWMSTFNLMGSLMLTPMLWWVPCDESRSARTAEML